MFIRPSDLALAHVTGHGTFSRTVVGTRRVGSARRAELSLEENLSSVEITLPLEHTLVRGEKLDVSLLTMRLFPTG